MDNNIFFYIYSKTTKKEDAYWRYYFDFTKKNKFDILHLDIEESSYLLQLFCQTQKIYNGFARLAHLFRYKRTPVKNDKDLGLNPMQPKRKAITFLHENAKYTMTISEVVQTINAALTHVNGFFILNNYMPKNPYTNVPFTKSILYNMYFAVKYSDIKMSPLFHAFFLYDFNLVYFSTINQEGLVEYAIYQHVYNTHHNELYQSVKNMINNHGMMRQLYIDPEFPKDVLVNAMRPYLLLSLRLMFSPAPEEIWSEIEIELTTALNVFYMYNPKFGRKYIRYKNKKRITEFEVKHSAVLTKKRPFLTLSF